MLTRIHVNKHHILYNKKNKFGDSKPVFTIKNYKGTKTADWVEIDGPSRMVYSPLKPLSCGAVAWIETQAEVFYGYC